MKILLLALLVMSSCAITGNTTRVPSEVHFNYTILFCDKSSCLGELLAQISNAEEVACALYNLDESVVDALEQRKAAVVIDSNSKIESPLLFKRKSPGLMHNKFCVFTIRGDPCNCSFGKPPATPRPSAEDWRTAAILLRDEAQHLGEAGVGPSRARAHQVVADRLDMLADCAEADHDPRCLYVTVGDACNCGALAKEQDDGA